MLEDTSRTEELEGGENEDVESQADSNGAQRGPFGPRSPAFARRCNRRFGGGSVLRAAGLDVEHL